MPARVLFVGLDATDPLMIERWSSEGRLPWLQKLLADGTTFELANPLAVIGGGVWQDLATGCSCGHTGVFATARQLYTGETAMRKVARHEVDPRAFWTAASDAGRRVAVVDVPHSVAPRELNGAFVGEWGTHDRLFGAESTPPELLGELRERHGDYPLWKHPDGSSSIAICDAHDGSVEACERLLEDLLAGIEQKTDLLLDVLARERWDLFACAFGEGQCSGHQLYRFLEDGAPPGHERLEEGIRLVYERLDSSLAALVEAAGPDATVLVVASHSFTRPTGGPQLLPEVLLRLGYSSGRGASAKARSRIPAPVRKVLRTILPRRARQTVQARVGTLPDPLGSPLTRAAALDGDRCGWIRLNLAGREPYGTVQPGGEADAALADIRSALMELEQPESGERVVSGIQSAREAFGPRHHPNVPDLIVNFRDDLGVLDSCRSDRVGLVRIPFQPAARRTGAHPPVPSSLWVLGPDVPPRAGDGTGHAIDLGPTILARLGVPVPEWMEGQPLLGEGT